ncbi:hypothetical protein [uncultured Gammaproteobacteria bacterium]|jgi:uncharacterized membrane protein YqjE|nr:hypothetical protein [uncultured Gammaproteobacteria bacterium]CAC9558390.1 hypothetical protein [uncultured Gammaproteobacteria bacterium]
MVSLGSISLFYASAVGVLVMLVVNITVFEWGFASYIICIIWAIIAVNRYNKEIIKIAK